MCVSLLACNLHLTFIQRTGHQFELVLQARNEFTDNEDILFISSSILWICFHLVHCSTAPAALLLHLCMPSPSLSLPLLPLPPSPPPSLSLSLPSSDQEHREDDLISIHEKICNILSQLRSPDTHVSSEAERRERAQWRQDQQVDSEWEGCCFANEGWGKSGVGGDWCMYIELGVEWSQ